MGVGSLSNFLETKIMKPSFKMKNSLWKVTTVKTSTIFLLFFGFVVIYLIFSSVKNDFDCLNKYKGDWRLSQVDTACRVSVVSAELKKKDWSGRGFSEAKYKFGEHVSTSSNTGCPIYLAYELEYRLLGSSSTVLEICSLDGEKVSKISIKNIPS